MSLEVLGILRVSRRRFMGIDTRRSPHTQVVFKGKGTFRMQEVVFVVVFGNGKEKKTAFFHWGLPVLPLAAMDC